MRYLIFIFLTTPLLAQKHSTLILEELKKRPFVDVLIHLNDKADLSSIQNNLSKKEKAIQAYNLLKQKTESQNRVLNYLRTASIEHRSFYIINAIHATINKEVLDMLLNFDEIKFIHYDEPIGILPGVDNTYNSLSARGPMLTWGLERIEADKVWSQGYEGQGVTIAGEDTGYNWEIEGIKTKYKGYNAMNQSVDHNYSWHDAIHKASPLSNDSINPCGYSVKVPCDDHGHGTHTAGTMTGSTDSDIFGVAPKAQWMGCRNMERGNGALSTYIECFEFFLAPTDLDGLNPKPELAPSAINNSWYCSREEGCDETNFGIMEEVVKNLRASGIVVVVSAGNSGQVCGNISSPPAMFKSSFTVGSFASNDSISYFSSSGPVYNYYKDTLIKPDVCAPGSEVFSKIHTGEFVAWSGTSMAGPHVAGLIALIINANPALDGNVDKIEEIIRLSSRPAESLLECTGAISSSRPNHVYGYGRILAPEAIRLAILTRSNDLDRDDEEFLIQPNLVTNSLRIIDFSEKSKTYSIVSITGEVIQGKINSHQSYNVSHLHSGMYMIRCDQTGRSNKFVKL